MSFFKKYNGTAHVGLMRLETLIWVLIYGGLLTLVLGGFLARVQDGSGVGVMIAGGLLVLIGAILLVVRSRLREEP